MHVTKLIEMHKQADEYQTARNQFHKTLKFDDMTVLIDIDINIDDNNKYKVTSDINYLGRSFHNLTAKQLHSLTKLKEQLDRWCSGEGEYPV